MYGIMLLLGAVVAAIMLAPGLQDALLKVCDITNVWAYQGSSYLTLHRGIM